MLTHSSFSWGKSLHVASFAYLVLPLAVFSIGYLRPLIGLPSLGILAFVLIQVYAEPASKKWGRVYSGRTLLILGFAALVWTYLGGQGGAWYQSPDWGVRNAIFRDLILRPWPVVYPEHGSALCYYIGHWLVPGAVAHSLLPYIGKDAALVLGNMLLWVWTWLGVTLVALNIFEYLKIDGRKQCAVVFAIFVFFSGLDVVGALLKGRLGELLAPESIHLEWWSGTQFSSMTTCLFWVFNQTVAAWLATILFMREKNASRYVLIAAGCFICGPFATVGLLILMIAQFMTDLFIRVRAGGWVEVKGMLQEALSVSNILTFLIVLPPLAMFFLGNSALHVETSQQVSGSEISTKSTIAFIVLEVGVYVALVARENLRNPLLPAAVVTFFICLFVHVGVGYDFTMRASIPALFVLMVLCAKMVLDVQGQKSRDKCYRWRRLILIACLIIGSLTPAVEIYRGFYHVAKERSFFLADESLYSIADTEYEGTSGVSNFECYEYESKPFFKYLAAG